MQYATYESAAQSQALVHAVTFMNLDQSSKVQHAADDSTVAVGAAAQHLTSVNGVLSMTIPTPPVSATFLEQQQQQQCSASRVHDIRQRCIYSYSAQPQLVHVAGTTSRNTSSSCYQPLEPLQPCRRQGRICCATLWYFSLTCFCRPLQ
jgi:hypothetical protein